MTENHKFKLLLEDGSIYNGRHFGFFKPTAGEVVFNTGMVGYPETLTDPSYKGQILVLTYPLIGNYGIPKPKKRNGIDYSFESDKIQISGLIVSEAVDLHNHWNSEKSLDRWLHEHEVPGFMGVDTRALTKKLRKNGTMLGKFFSNGSDEIQFYDPNEDILLPQVSVKEPIVYRKGKKKVILVDCGCKNNIIRVLLSFDLTVIRVPWDYDYTDEKFDGIVISNGPGDPEKCLKTVTHIQRILEKEKPILGICLGNQILALAAGADTYKLKFGHRSQNQPCMRVGSKRCYITSQNHGFAVDNRSLPQNWRPWFINANDGTNEGVLHDSKPFFGVQFHPEASPGPTDTRFIFQEFVNKL
jgi:carbamoyl-phosphate synthase small subunit